MSTRRNHAGKVLAMLSLMCAVAASAAFGAEGALARGGQDNNHDPLFLTATNPARASSSYDIW